MYPGKVHPKSASPWKDFPALLSHVLKSETFQKAFSAPLGTRRAWAQGRCLIRFLRTGEGALSRSPTPASPKRPPSCCEQIDARD